jgi:hypothetical protein
MKHIIFLLLFLPFIGFSQGGTWPVKYGDSDPSGAPSAAGTRLYFNTATNTLFFWEPAPSSTWRKQPKSFDQISGCAAPAYTPTSRQSTFAVNSCTPKPELYQWTGSAWALLNPETLYTEGTGIDITGGVITNTAPDQTVTMTDGTGIDVTGTYPDFTITNTAPNVVQTLSIAGQDLSLSGGGGTVAIPGGGPDSALAKINDIYVGKRIDDNIYKNGTLGLRTTDTAGVLNVAILDSTKTAISIRSTNNTSGQNFIKLKPIGITGLSNIGSFNIVGQKYSGVNLPYSSTPNYVWNIGYNIGTNGGREVSSEPAFGFGLERYFQNSSLSSGSTGFSEFHARYTDTTGFEHRFLSGILPWDGRPGKAQFGINTDQLNYSDYNYNPVWIINPFTNTWDFYDTTDMKFGERRGFGLKVLNGAGSFYMDLLTFNNSDNLRIGNIGQMPEVQIESDLVLQRSRLYAASGDASIQIGSSSRKQNLIINGFNDEALRMVGGSSGRTWSFEAGNQFALRDITANTYPQFFYSGLSNFVFIMRDNNVGFGGVPSNFPLARLHVYSPSGASANLIAIDNTTGTNYFRRSNATPEAAITASPGDVTIGTVSGVGAMFIKETGSATNTGHKQVLTTGNAANFAFGTSTSAATSAQLEVISTTKGFLPPRMTTTQRDAIASPATGLEVFNTTTAKKNIYDGAAWAEVAVGTFNGNFSGTGTATTAFTVTLPTTQSDATYSVSIMPKNALSATGWYISARTTTTFTITYLTGLTGAVDFDYIIVN